MRLTDKQSKELKEKAKKLHNNGLNHKNIAKELGLTPKTVGKWLKTCKDFENLQMKLIQRINKALKDEETPIKDIFCLFQSLSVCRNIRIS